MAHHHRLGAQARHGSGGSEPEAVRIWLLGGFRVSVGSRTVEAKSWRLKKAASLIKLLALAQGHRLHRERVTDALWPDLDTRPAANNLHRTLHFARGVLEEEEAPADTTSRYLVLRGELLELCPEGPLWVDVNAFESAAATARRSREPAAYRAAVELYAGDLLPEDLYEEWASERREELRRLYLALLLEMSALHEEREEYEPAIEALWLALAVEPAHEEAHRALMRLFAASGERRRALAQYEQLKKSLSEELDAGPAPESRRLYEEILAGGGGRHRSRSGSRPSKEPTAATRHNLPNARTSFVGRQTEMVGVKRSLAMSGVLTLTGAGGCGKTRLALEVARDLVGAYPDGVWLVELAPLADPELVPQAVAQALGVREQPGQPLVETLSNHLRSKRTLLVMDNCEHLIEGCARLVDALLDSCSGLRVLATSREALGVAGETNWPVSPLSLPEARTSDAERRLPPVEELARYEAIGLFVERARSRLPDFELTEENARGVVEVCRKLEGIPLGIELACGRLSALAVEQIMARLNDSLRLLTTGARTADPRHQTLRATLDWSYELLGEAERELFGRLSVFAGGWTLEAAEEVCSGDGIERDDVLDLLGRLVEKSLVVAEAPSSPGEEGALRYRMLEPVRQYGQERLKESGEAERVRERHAEYYLALTEGEAAERADPGVWDSRPVAWLKWMESEHANLRAALDWSLDEDAEPDGRAELGLRLAVTMWWFWYTQGSLIEGRRYLERALSGRSGPTTTRLRARALNGAAGIALFQGDYGAAKALVEEGLALCRELGDEEGIASALTELGLIAVVGQRDDIPVPALLEELGELKPRLKNRNTLAYLLILEGTVAISRGDLERSVTLHEESLKLFREMRDTPGILTCLVQLGVIALIRADYEGAASLLREALRVGWESDFKLVIQSSLHGLAVVAACREQPVRAARLWGAVEGMQEAYGVRLTPMALSVSNYEGHLTTVRSQLGEETFAAAWAEGEAMPLERVVEYALSDEEEERVAPSLVPPPEQPPADDEPAERLTPREREVALLVGRELTNRQIADALSISEHTVANHVGKILKKLGLRSRAQIGPS